MGTDHRRVLRGWRSVAVRVHKSPAVSVPVGAVRTALPRAPLHVFCICVRAYIPGALVLLRRPDCAVSPRATGSGGQEPRDDDRGALQMVSRKVTDRWFGATSGGEQEDRDHSFTEPRALQIRRCYRNAVPWLSNHCLQLRSPDCPLVLPIRLHRTMAVAQSQACVAGGERMLAGLSSAGGGFWWWHLGSERPR